jgi:hypothetical protein
MALISCKECSKEVSDKARVCPHCGARLKMALWLKIILWIFGIWISLVFISVKSQFQKLSKHKSDTENIKMEKVVDGVSNN